MTDTESRNPVRTSRAHGTEREAEVETDTGTSLRSFLTTNSETRVSTSLKSTRAREIIEARSVVTESGCWDWTGNIQGAAGYGRIHVGHRTSTYAHRLSYEAFVGPIPEGLVIDHLCRNRRCVNPAHLEPVTNGENVRRGEGCGAQYAKRTHCARGHLLVPNPKRPGMRRCADCAGRSVLGADDPRHGTVTGYANNGCRCVPCKDAERAYRKARR